MFLNTNISFPKLIPMSSILLERGEWVGGPRREEMVRGREAQ